MTISESNSTPSSNSTSQITSINSNTTSTPNNSTTITTNKNSGTTTESNKRGSKRTRESINENKEENEIEKTKIKLTLPSKNLNSQKEIVQETFEEKDEDIDIWNFNNFSSSFLRRKEYLRWLKLLQFNQNILCFGIGSKYEVIHEFAKSMLVDEDVIELSPFTSTITNSSILSSSTSSTTSHRKKSGEEILWNLFQFIRHNILNISNGTGGNRIPPSSIWSFHSDGNLFPLEFEAQLISGDILFYFDIFFFLFFIN